MSLQALTWALDQDVPNSGAKLVLISLANYADHTSGEAYPGQKLLAQEASMTSRSVRRHLVALEKMGLIERQRRTRKDGSRTSDLYILKIANRTKSTGQPENVSSLEPVSEPTLPKGSDATASANEVLTDTVWRLCPDKLQALGVSDKWCRSMLGKWLKAYQPEKVLRAVKAAERIGTRDPIPYITEVLAKGGAANTDDGDKIIVRRNTKPFEAWQKYCARTNNPKIYTFKLNDKVEVPSLWPPRF